MLQKENNVDANNRHSIGLPMLILGLACAGGVAAQSQLDTRSLDKPAVRTLSCGQVDIGWNLELLNQFPNIPGACHEVVTSHGTKWARFEADFVRINSDGSVTSDFVGPNGRPMGRYTLIPFPGQQVTLDGRKYPFSALRPNQRINLYVPEGATGLASEPAASTQQFTRIARYEEAPAPPMQVAQATPRQAYVADRLPNTAGPLPWFALGSALSFLGALGLRFGRRSRQA